MLTGRVFHSTCLNLSSRATTALRCPRVVHLHLATSVSSNPTTSTSNFVCERRLINSASQTRFYAVEAFKPTEEGEQKRERQKVRRAYALGSGLLIMWLSTHAILLWRRRNEHHALNEKMPPISLEDFVVQHLAAGQVKTIVFQPSFGVANVYLHNADEREMKKTVQKIFTVAPDRFTRPPDVRFLFEGDVDSLRKSIAAAQKAFLDGAPQAEQTAIEFEVDQFPSYRKVGDLLGYNFNPFFEPGEWPD